MTYKSVVYKTTCYRTFIKITQQSKNKNDVHIQNNKYYEEKFKVQRKNNSNEKNLHSINQKERGRQV